MTVKRLALLLAVPLLLLGCHDDGDRLAAEAKKREEASGAIVLDHPVNHQVGKPIKRRSNEH